MTVVTKKKVTSIKTIRTIRIVSHEKKINRNESRSKHETGEINGKCGCTTLCKAVTRGFAIRSSEVLERERGKINDPVMYRLLHIGVLDQQGVNEFQSQALQAVRWASATCVCLFQRILKIKTQVCHSGRPLLT